ncbi:hypothetical protein HID58_094366 [Brassica napus]|uniref:Uncharacterized protein n=1 Tax=Brassica napus TaxID=3708 RepID=A0ABQ7X7H6_BRANA|nr:hypothetical protein HID58_094366 [Brassica napus]
MKAMDCNLLPQNSHSPPYSYSPLFSNILSYFCYLFSNTLVLSLRMVIGVCAWLSQEDNTSSVDLEQHQKQALGVRTNGLRFMDPRQEDLEEKWL